MQEQVEAQDDELFELRQAKERSQARSALLEAEVAEVECLRQWKEEAQRKLDILEEGDLSQAEKRHFQDMDRLKKQVSRWKLSLHLS